MVDFIVNSLIASVALTALVNVIPRLFPGSSAEARMREMLGEDPIVQQPGDQQPGADQSSEGEPTFRIWFPWKQMLLWSMAITVFINIIALLD